jgi:hypothetical protein
MEPQTRDLVPLTPRPGRQQKRVSFRQKAAEGTPKSAAYQGCREKNNKTTQTKDKNMKTNRLPSVLRATNLVLAAIATLVLASAANAQTKPANGDGIAASPKVRQMLNERKKSYATNAVRAPAMACAKCFDIWTTKLNPQAKGAEVLAGAATKLVAKHACGGCETSWTVVGGGKTKHSVATHKCTAEVANNFACCDLN